MYRGPHARIQAGRDKVGARLPSARWAYIAHRRSEVRGTRQGSGPYGWEKHLGTIGNAEYARITITYVDIG